VNYGHQSGFTMSEVTMNAWVRHPRRIWTTECANVAERIDRGKEGMKGTYQINYGCCRAPSCRESVLVNFVINGEGSIPLE